MAGSSEFDVGRWLLREHPALLISGLYLLASTIGMFFAWDFLRRFGINVFLYAELGDFLLASLKEPLTWALAIVAVGSVLIDNTFSRRAASKQLPRWLRFYGSPRYRKINYLIAALLIMWLLNLLATKLARQVHAGDGDIVEVRLADSDLRQSSTLLGTTTQFVFLFDSTTKRVTILPNENIAAITFFAPRE